MKFTPLPLAGVHLIEPKVYEDHRGHFFESFQSEVFHKETGETISFVQDNQSFSVKNVLRGLHYQASPKGQAKLVRVLTGEIFDVVVDIRPDSPTYGQHLTVVLSAKNKLQLFIPEGFAHGFLTLSDTAEMLYKTSEFYSQEHEMGLNWNDSELNIDWPLTHRPILSPKDQQYPAFQRNQQ